MFRDNTCIKKCRPAMAAFAGQKYHINLAGLSLDSTDFLNCTAFQGSFVGKHIITDMTAC